MVKYFVWWEIIRRWSKYVFTTPFPRFLFHSVHVFNDKMFKVDWLWSLSINDKREKCVWVSHYWWSEQPVSSVCKLCVFSQFLGSCLVSGVRDKIGCRVLREPRAMLAAGPGRPRAVAGANCKHFSRLSLRLWADLCSPGGEISRAGSGAGRGRREGVIQLVSRQTLRSESFMSKSWRRYLL